MCAQGFLLVQGAVPMSKNERQRWKGEVLWEVYMGMHG